MSYRMAAVLLLLPGLAASTPAGASPNPCRHEQNLFLACDSTSYVTLTTVVQTVPGQTYNLTDSTFVVCRSTTGEIQERLLIRVARHERFWENGAPRMAAHQEYLSETGPFEYLLERGMAVAYPKSPFSPCTFEFKEDGSTWPWTGRRPASSPPRSSFPCFRSTPMQSDFLAAGVFAS